MTAIYGAAAATPVGLRERILAKAPQMSAAMTKIADVLLQDLTAPLELSITELADQAGVSAATVTRFCRVLGYSGYVPFRVAVASAIGRGDAEESWHADIGRMFSPNDTPAETLSSLQRAYTASLTATTDQIDVDQLCDIARRIVGCRHLDIYGIGGSGGMAVELEARLYRIGINAHAWQEVHSGLASAALQDEESIALAISNTGRTEDTIEMLSQARCSGAYTVAVTSSSATPLAAIADAHVMAFAPGGYLQPDDLSAKHAQLFVLDLLYLLIAQQTFAKTITALAASAMAVSGHRREARSSRQRPGRTDARKSAIGRL
jgi:DNA-binding MurR/RpiR family transcriptional regulator